MSAREDSTISPTGPRIAFEIRGSGPELLLLSGQSDDRHAWDRVAGDLTNDFRVIRMDYAGTGRSGPLVHDSATTRGFARDAIAVLDAVGAPTSHVYGISMGGRVAQWMAIDQPSRVNRLVLAATTPGGPHSDARAPWVSEAIVRSGSSPAEQLQTDLLLQVSEGWAAANPDYVAFRRNRLQTMPPEPVREAHFRASESHDAWSDLARITAPTLVIHGTDDAVNPPSNASTLATRIPNSTLVLIEGGRHGFFEEYREETTRIVRDFLLDPQPLTST